MNKLPLRASLPVLMLVALLLGWAAAGELAPVLAQGVAGIPVDLAYDQNAGVYHATFSLANPTSMRRLILDIEEGGASIWHREEPINGRPTVQLDLPTSALKPGGKYTLIVRADTFDGTWVIRPGTGSNNGDPRILTSLEFEYNKLGGFQIRAVNPRYDLNKLLIDLAIPQDLAAQVAKYQVFVVDKGGQTVLDSGPQVFQGIPLQVDLSDAFKHPSAPPEYKVSVNLTTKDDLPVEQSFDGFKPAPAPEPTLMDRATSALQKNPVLQGGVVLIAIVAVSWAVIGGRRKKKAVDEWARPPIDQTMAVPVPVIAAPTGTPTPAARQHVRVRVTQSPGSARGLDRTVTSFPCVIGRQDCDINIPGDRQVSRRHAEIALRSGRLFLTDLGSTNGTFAGDAQLQPQNPVPVTGKMRVRLGTETLLEIEPQS
jgi:hypothetical protein